MIVFKYKAESVGDKEIKIKRPVADVYLQDQFNHWLEFHPYIDSGADLTMIPLSLGKLLGLKMGNETITQIGGIRGSVPVIYKKIKMKIGNEEFAAAVAWALIENIPPLLGRQDVFDRFQITFKQSQEIILFG